ncbi:MAG: peptide ABC transporter substrate-binding protein [Clostridiales bacterium]|nr:peptide ABC transporter substrate-binding protein [Clostridiales bacterium]
MKKIKRIFSLILAVILVSVSFSGCSSSDAKTDFIYPFSGDIVSFDPQIASTADEFLIIENCFEGLVRVNDDGSVQAGVAKSWDISEDGKTYTFYLRTGAKWYIEEDGSAEELFGKGNNPDITANDFVFALQRAADKDTDAPLFFTISNIKNANKVHSGKLKASELGVKAIDDYTLEITLNSADSSFLSVLATAIAMPCNEEFFNATKGRYSLGLEYSVFNGQFYLSSILESSYILKNNEQYVGDYPSAVTDITLNITDENTDIAKYLKSGYYDAAYITGQEYHELKDSGITATSYSDTTVAFVLNKNNTLFSLDKLRQAVCLCTSEIDLTDREYLSDATGFSPPSCTIGDKSAPDAIGDINYSQDIKEARELWKSGLEELGASEADFTVIVPEEYEDIAKELVQGIQKGIGQVSAYSEDDDPISFSLKIEALSDSEFSSAFSSGEYDLALYKFSATSQSSLNFLDEIINGGFLSSTTDAQNALKKAQSADADELAKAVKKCEKAILEDYTIKPIFYESSYYAQAQGVSGVQFHPGSGRVCFVNATRED